FAADDTPNNMRYERDSTTVVTPWPTVKGGAVFKLVERLTYPLYFDIRYIQQFLLTYRAFMKPTQLLHLLVERYDVPYPPYLTTLQCLQFARTVRNPIQTRVVNVLVSACIIQTCAGKCMYHTDQSVECAGKCVYHTDQSVEFAGKCVYYADQSGECAGKCVNHTDMCW
ncbi:hypothetical protein SARC_17296, partial [Sphaeroforma arctica JP610]